MCTTFYSVNPVLNCGIFAEHLLIGMTILIYCAQHHTHKMPHSGTLHTTYRDVSCLHCHTGRGGDDDGAGLEQQDAVGRGVCSYAYSCGGL